jgi:hypothetical protein
MPNTSNKNSKKENDILAEHPIASKVLKEPGYSNATLLVGYIGKTDNINNIRLYTNLDFDEFFDIPKECILHAARAPEDVLSFGGTYLWVKKDEIVVRVRVKSTKEQAKFLQGDISAGLQAGRRIPKRAMLRRRGGRSDEICIEPSDEIPCRPRQTRNWESLLCQRGSTRGGLLCETKSDELPCGGWGRGGVSRFCSSGEIDCL